MVESGFGFAMLMWSKSLWPTIVQIGYIYIIVHVHLRTYVYPYMHVKIHPSCGWGRVPYIEHSWSPQIQNRPGQHGPQDTVWHFQIQAGWCSPTQKSSHQMRWSSQLRLVFRTPEGPKTKGSACCAGPCASFASRLSNREARRRAAWFFQPRIWIPKIGLWMFME